MYTVDELLQALDPEYASDDTRKKSSRVKIRFLHRSGIYNIRDVEYHEEADEVHIII